MWITPTSATIKSRISGPELDALKSAARAAGQTPDGLVDDAITRVVNLIRGYCAKHNQLGTSGTIPDELESSFGALWLYEFITRLPNSSKLLDDRRAKAYDDPMRLLRDVSSGAFKVVPPESAAPATEQAGGSSIKVVSSSIREADRQSTQGLF